MVRLAANAKFADCGSTLSYFSLGWVNLRYLDSVERGYEAGN